MCVVTQLFREVSRLFALAAHNIPGEGRMDQVIALECRSGRGCGSRG